MKFWGVEVKSGGPYEVQIGATQVLHLSQVCLGESNVANGESVYMYTQVQGKKLVLGKLHSENLYQQQFDLVFHKSFTLSHSWKHGSVYFLGYLSVAKDGDSKSEDLGKPSPGKYAKPGKAEEVDSDSDSDSDSAENDDSSDDNSTEEEETPLNQSRNQDRAILRANYIPNLADRKKDEKHIGNPHPRMRPPKKANVKAAVKKNEDEDELNEVIAVKKNEDEDELNKIGKKRQNEFKDATTNKKARVIKQEPQD